MMQETLQALEAIGKIAGGSLGGSVVVVLVIVAWAKKKGILELFEAHKESAGCPDPLCRANMTHRAERQSDLEEHVYEVLTPKMNEIAENVAFIKGKLS